MHNTTHNGPLTGVNQPIHRCRGSGARVSLSTGTGSAHRGARRVTKAVVYITARGLGSILDGSVCPSAGFQRDYGDVSLQLDYVNTTCRKRLKDGDSVMVMRSGGGHDDRMEVAENGAVTH